MQKLVVNENCIGCGACCAIDSEHFDFDNNLGISKVISQDNLESEGVLEAIDACPVGAILLTECETCPNCTCQEKGTCEEEIEQTPEEAMAA